MGHFFARSPGFFAPHAAKANGNRSHPGMVCCTAASSAGGNDMIADHVIANDVQANE